jgi:hypothetical protein
MDRIVLAQRMIGWERIGEKRSIDPLDVETLREGTCTLA